MYRCSVELSVQYDGQSQTESEHACLIDEHDSFNSVAKQIRFVFCLSSVRKHCRLNLQFDMLDFNTGFALVVRLVNTIFPKKLPDGTFSSI